MVTTWWNCSFVTGQTEPGSFDPDGIRPAQRREAGANQWLQTPNIGSLTGIWTYRSFLNDPDMATDFNALSSVAATSR